MRIRKLAGAAIVRQYLLIPAQSFPLAWTSEREKIWSLGLLRSELKTGRDAFHRNQHVHRYHPREPASSFSFLSPVSLIYRGEQNVEFLNNPARFLEPYHFRVTFECIAPLEDGAFLPLPYALRRDHFGGN